MHDGLSSFTRGRLKLPRLFWWDLLLIPHCAVNLDTKQMNPDYVSEYIDESDSLFDLNYVVHY